MIPSIIQSGSFGPRKAKLSFLLSFFCPGLGQLYNGQLVKAFTMLLFLGGLVFLPFVYHVSKVQNNILHVTMISFFLFIVVYVYMLFDAVIIARKKQQIALQWFHSWTVYVVYIGNTFLWIALHLYLAAHIYFFKIIHDNTMFPTLQPGDVVLAIKVNTADLQIADIVLHSEKSPVISRLIMKQYRGTIACLNGNIVLGNKKLEYGIVASEELKRRGVVNDQYIFSEHHNGRRYLVYIDAEKKYHKKFSLNRENFLLIPDNRVQPLCSLYTSTERFYRIEGIIASTAFRRIASLPEL